MTAKRSIGLQLHRGKGPGYWDRVSNDYEQGLDGVADKIGDVAVARWKAEVTDPLGRFLSED